MLLRTWRPQRTRSNKIKAAADTLHRTVPRYSHWQASEKYCTEFNSEGFRSWCITVRIIGFLESSGILKNARFEHRICFRPQVRGWGAPALLGPFERANVCHWTRDWASSAKAPFLRISCRCFQLAQLTRVGLPRTLFVGRQYFRWKCLQMRFKMLRKRSKNLRDFVCMTFALQVSNIPLNCSYSRM
jgi:hypothetical protein